MESIEVYKNNQMQEIQLLKEQVLLIEANLQKGGFSIDVCFRCQNQFDGYCCTLGFSLYYQEK